MENDCSTEVVPIGIGPLGGGGGKRFIYKPQSLIKQIVVRHAGVIDSLRFICQEGKLSPRFGGSGGEKTHKVNISPSEYLTGITGTIGSYSGYRVIGSLRFHTNVTTYGPFGSQTNEPFTLPVEDGFIVDFHGRSGAYLDAIGYYVRPLQTSPLKSNSALIPKNPVPFGGTCHSLGKEFDDGSFSGIERIIVHVDNVVNVLQGFRIQYLSDDGEGGHVWSQRHGAHSLSLNKIHIEYPDEFLIGISGYYGPVQSDAEVYVIKSITFLTNKDVWERNRDFLLYSSQWW